MVNFQQTQKAANFKNTPFCTQKINIFWYETHFTIYLIDSAKNSIKGPRVELIRKKPGNSIDSELETTLIHTAHVDFLEYYWGNMNGFIHFYQ